MSARPSVCLSVLPRVSVGVRQGQNMTETSASPQSSTINQMMVGRRLTNNVPGVSRVIVRVRSKVNARNVLRNCNSSSAHARLYALTNKQHIVIVLYAETPPNYSFLN